MENVYRDRELVQKIILKTSEIETAPLLGAATFLLTLNNLPQLSPALHKLRPLLGARIAKELAPDTEPALYYLGAAALLGYHTDLFEGAKLSHAIYKLTELETKPGGPYAYHGEIDFGLNAVIRHFLHLQGITLPELETYVAGQKKSKTLASNFFSPGLLAQLLLKPKSTPAEKASANDPEEDRIISRMLMVANERFRTLSPELRAHASNEIRKTIKANTDRQMPLMPYYFRKAIGAKGKDFSDDLIVQLGLTNVYFWTAFVIYDNFWDEDEEALPAVLPTANLYAREFTSFFETALPGRNDFLEFFHGIMDRLDGANTWETTHCRMPLTAEGFVVPTHIPDFGDYSHKYEPASAHILGSVLMLCQLGYAITSDEVQNLIAYFKNYLIPMQLNDDLHDWREDLARGHISTVVALLLEDLAAKPGSILSLTRDLPELEQTFWFKTMPRACALGKPYLEKARSACRALGSVTDHAPLEQYIERIERSIVAAEKEHRTSNEFLNAFHR